ncbi:MAG: DUF4097 family beta strand repeat-containing protein [Planctomycetota bacterium]|jgi:hypothetical protein
MRRLVCLLLFAAACSGSESSELSFPAGELEDFILRFQRGSITVRHPTGNEDPKTCLVKVEESGGAETLTAEARFNAAVTKRRVRLRQRRNEPKLSLKVEVVVPKGVHLDLVLREGSISIDGSFGRVAATTTTGAITANLASCEAATVKASSGDVELSLGKSTIKGNVTCETLSGDCTVTIPAGLRGPINLYSETAQIDLGKQPKVAFLLDPERKSARAFAGTKMSPEELAQAKKENRWPPGIWGKTQSGKVTFRVD